MPEQLITVSDFVSEAWDDYKSPTTSSFVDRISHCKNTVLYCEEVGCGPLKFLEVYFLALLIELSTIFFVFMFGFGCSQLPIFKLFFLMRKLKYPN